MTMPVTGEFREANEALLLGADVSARVTDDELAVLVDAGRPAVLAAMVFSLCEQAERISPGIANIIDSQGYPMTHRDEVWRAVTGVDEMHLRPYDRRFLVITDIHLGRSGCEGLFGRPIGYPDDRKGVSVRLENENVDMILGYIPAAEERIAEIRGYTRRLFAEVLNGIDLVTEADKYPYTGT